MVKNKDVFLFGSEYLEDIDEDNSLNYFDDERLINIIVDCFGGGYEKLLIVFCWVVVYFVFY